ncbi:MAG: hypothetical protein LBN27_02095 [Prevotellaceae bacterium]|jgi:allophanate hydrolase subunit 1|nr:hypothetical protein [Prevotellaceae bacterium]
MKEIIISAVNHFDNRSNVTLHVTGEHNAYVTALNAIHAICKKHNAQENIYENRSALKSNRLGNVIDLTHGSSGGTVTFHSHSCDPKAAVQELVNLANNEN